MEQPEPDRSRLPVTSLLVGLDGSPFAEQAIAPAGRIAAKLGVPLRLWSAVPTPAEARSREQRLRSLGETIGASWEVVVADRPVEAMMATREAAGQALICLATHGRDRTAALAHSVSTAVVAASDGPVLLVGPAVSAEAPTGGTLAACVDGSPASDVIVATAVAWAAALGLEVILLTVAEPVPESILHPGSYPRLHGPHDDADVYVEKLAAAWRGDVSVTGRAIYDPVDVDRALIAAFADDPPDLVVMGTRAPYGLRRLILGSTAAAVAHDSPAPVLVVPV